MIEPRISGLEDRMDRVESALVRLSEAQVGTANNVDALTQQFIQMVAAQNQFEQRLGDLVAGQVSTTQTVDQLTVAQVRTEERLSRLIGGMDQLVAAQVRTEQRLDQLIERIDQLTARMDQLAERMDQLTERMGQLAEAQTHTEDRPDALVAQVGSLHGWALEARYRERAHSYFQSILRRIRVVPADELAAMAEDAEERGVISARDQRDLLNADIIMRGRLRNPPEEAYLVVGVSATVDTNDVERAARRASLLQQISEAPALAAVAGTRINRFAAEDVVRLGVRELIESTDEEDEP